MNDPSTGRLERLGAWLLSSVGLRRHRLVFFTAVGGLTLCNVLIGGGWWAFWPVFVWALIYFLHLCLVQATNVNEEWVDERTDELRLRSYDLGHIDDIENRYNTGGRVGATRRARRAKVQVEHRYPIIDAHHHLWDLERNYYPWLANEPPVEGRHGDYRAIRETYLPSHFQRDWGVLNVAGSVHVEAEWDPATPGGETRWLAQIYEEHGLPNATVAHAMLDASDLDEVLATHATFPFMRGIRDKPAVAASAQEIEVGAPGSMSDPSWQAGYAKLADFGFSFDLQAPYWHMNEAAALAQAHPKTLMIINHAGLPVHRDAHGLAAWRDAMGAVASVPNVVLKISGLGGPHLQPWSVAKHLSVVHDAIDIFGPERCMFGSNYPVERLYAPYESIMRGFMEMVHLYPIGERRRMLHDNACEYYRIAL